MEIAAIVGSVNNSHPSLVSIVIKQCALRTGHMARLWALNITFKCPLCHDFVALVNCSKLVWQTTIELLCVIYNIVPVVLLKKMYCVIVALCGDLQLLWNILDVKPGPAACTYNIPSTLAIIFYLIIMPFQYQMAEISYLPAALAASVFSAHHHPPNIMTHAVTVSCQHITVNVLELSPNGTYLVRACRVRGTETPNDTWFKRKLINYSKGIFFAAIHPDPGTSCPGWPGWGHLDFTGRVLSWLCVQTQAAFSGYFPWSINWLGTAPWPSKQ